MLNEPLLKATLAVVLDGQAVLYATIMTTGSDRTHSQEEFESYTNEYKVNTARLIMEAMEKANETQDNNS